MRFLKSSILILLLVACSPQKQLNRLIKRHPELLSKDTINFVVHDTIVVEKFSHDTTTLITHHDSTIVVNNENVILKYFYDTLTREIFHEVTCFGDTIFYTKEVPIVVEKVVVVELTWWEKWRDTIIIIGVIILLLILFKKFSKVLL